MISTIKFLQGNWCKDYDITYEWVNGHEDRENEEPNKEERLSIKADELCDVIRNEAMGPLAARGNCASVQEREYDTHASQRSNHQLYNWRHWRFQRNLTF
jgi:hypothetical protein